MVRVPRVAGMSGVNRHTLEFLWNAGDEIYANPSTIAANIDYKKNTVQKAVIELRKAGLLEYYDEDGGIYQLTGLGRRYLQNELEESEIGEIEASLEG